jgi:hypothetical protein
MRGLAALGPAVAVSGEAVDDVPADEPAARGGGAADFAAGPEEPPQPAAARTRASAAAVAGRVALMPARIGAAGAGARRRNAGRRALRRPKDLP